MCLLVLQFRTFAEAPVLIAANREEYFDRPAHAPAVQAGHPRVLCGLDARAGGTWLGVNQHGLVVGVTNRLRTQLPDRPRSRGLLCRELLNCSTAAEAGQLAVTELESGNYAGANFLCVDAHHAMVVQYAEDLRVVELPPGLHLMTNWALDDRTDERQLLARYLFAARFPNSADAFIQRALEVCRYRAEEPGRLGIVLRTADRGTVSSTIMAVSREPQRARFLFADGAPDEAEYRDLSADLRELLTVSLARST